MITSQIISFQNIHDINAYIQWAVFLLFLQLKKDYRDISEMNCVIPLKIIYAVSIECQYSGYALVHLSHVQHLLLWLVSQSCIPETCFN